MKSIEKINTGYKFEYTIEITKEMHFGFMKFSGDDSPIHKDMNIAMSNNFKKPIGYAFLLTCILSKIYGTIFPGGNELCLKQECNFPNPYYVGDELRFILEVINKNEGLKLLTVMVIIKNQDNKIIFKGQSVFQLSLKI